MLVYQRVWAFYGHSEPMKYGDLGKKNAGKMG
jgi:hypothetical protein